MHFQIATHFQVPIRSSLPHQHQSRISPANEPRSCCTSSSKRADLAVLVIRPRADLLRLLACVIALVLVARLVLILAAVGDCASVAIVCVNAAASAAVAAAVATGSHDFAVVGCVEVLDVEGALE